MHVKRILPSQPVAKINKRVPDVKQPVHTPKDELSTKLDPTERLLAYTIVICAVLLTVYNSYLWLANHL